MMSEQHNKPTEIKGDAFQPPVKIERDRDTDRSTVWYVLANEERDMRILRTTLMDQNAQTLEEWKEHAQTLIAEIERMKAWHNAGK